LLAAGEAARGDQTEDARKVVAAAIRALGCHIKIGGHKGVICKAEGTFQEGGRSVPCAVRLVFQPPYQHSQVLSGSGFKVTTVLNGDRAWRSTNGTVIELNKEQIREYKQILFSEQAVGLTPLLTAEGMSLLLLKESKVEGRMCIGVRVRYKSYRDLILHLDLKTGLLLKMEMIVKDKGTYFTQETFFHDYEAFDDVRRPRWIITTRDGKDYLSWQLIEHRTLEKKLGDFHFSRPR
jgi:hypothetical protein